MLYSVYSIKGSELLLCCSITVEWKNEEQKQIIQLGVMRFSSRAAMYIPS